MWSTPCSGDGWESRSSIARELGTAQAITTRGGSPCIMQWLGLG